MKEFFRQSAVGMMALAMALGFSAAVKANPSVGIQDITDWGTTPMEIVSGTFPIQGSPYTGGVYAGINTLKLKIGTKTYIVDGFCIDPFHYSISGAYTDEIVPLKDAPKPPGPMGATTATEIEQLWYELYSSHMSDMDAAVLQVAIWDLVSGTSSINEPIHWGTDSTTVTVQQAALADIADLQTGNHPTTALIGLTGAGQDYVVAVPDGGPGWVMLAGSLMALALFRQKVIRSQSSKQALAVFNR